MALQDGNLGVGGSALDEDEVRLLADRIGRSRVKSEA